MINYKRYIGLLSAAGLMPPPALQRLVRFGRLDRGTPPRGSYPGRGTWDYRRAGTISQVLPDCRSLGVGPSHALSIRMGVMYRVDAEVKTG